MIYDLNTGLFIFSSYSLVEKKKIIFPFQLSHKSEYFRESKKLTFGHTDILETVSRVSNMIHYFYKEYQFLAYHQDNLMSLLSPRSTSLPLNFCLKGNESDLILRWEATKELRVLQVIWGTHRRVKRCNGYQARLTEHRYWVRFWLCVLYFWPSAKWSYV